MLNLELSTFYGDFEELDALAQLLEIFNRQSSATVKTKRMHWMTSWSDLISVASLGSGPDISQIGNTWISSLTGLNAIRTFKAGEIKAIGGEQLFPQGETPHPCWSIPWTSYAFVLCYRKDHFAEKGIDPARAFSRPDETLETIKKLDDGWLTPFVPNPYPDMLHIAASWVWGSGGELVVCHNNRPQIVFDQPAAMHGLRNWLDSYRAVPPEHRLNSRDCMTLFQQGKASAAIIGVRMANTMLGSVDEKTRQQIGFAPLSQTPWVGGDSLVIWKHAQREAEREKMAIELVKFLTSPENTIQFCRSANSLPARRDALEALYPPSHPLHTTVQTISKNGRCYPAINEWRSIEHQLVQELDSIVHEAYKSPARTSAEILEKHLQPLAQRLNRTM